MFVLVYSHSTRHDAASCEHPQTYAPVADLYPDQKDGKSMRGWNLSVLENHDSIPIPVTEPAWDPLPRLQAAAPGKPLPQSWPLPHNTELPQGWCSTKLVVLTSPQHMQCFRPQRQRRSRKVMERRRLRSLRGFLLRVTLVASTCQHTLI